MTSGLTEDKEKLESKMEEQVPLARISKPDEQAGMVVFLLSDHASCTLSSFPHPLAMFTDASACLWQTLPVVITWSMEAAPSGREENVNSSADAYQWIKVVAIAIAQIISGQKSGIQFTCQSFRQAASGRDYPLFPVKVADELQVSCMNLLMP
jgi:hypothetical protein